MIAPEKAEELVNKFRVFAHCPFSKDTGETIAQTDVEHHNAVQCALLFCNEMISEYRNQMFRRGFINKCTADNMVHYWKKVKKEINKL